VKRFVKVEGHADSYEDLTIKFVKGKPPRLLLYDDDGSLFETHNIERLTTQEIHDLLQSKGFARTLDVDESDTVEVSKEKDEEVPVQDTVREGL